MAETAKKAWEYLIKNGLTEAGAAGLLGNLQAESGIIPNRVEILCLKRLKEHGKIYTDATYTAFVDDGTISRGEFLNPLPGKQYGYGLSQWTSPGRKAGLYDLCKSRKVSIGDLTAQLDWLLTELKTSYASTYRILATTKDILTASNTVLLKFECPADTGAAVRQLRYNYAKSIYDELTGTIRLSGSEAQAATKDQAIQAVINIATDEIGYLEKKSNASLDSKTANTGSGNYTKYWRDVYPSFQGQPWCACFVSWCFMKAFGLETAKKLLKHWPYTYCPTLAGLTTNKTPKKGSVIIFYRNGTYAHTGIVTEVEGTRITTIEGNTSGASGIIANGGGVCRKIYDRNTLSGSTKYFMPDYSIVTGVSTTPSSGSGSAAEIKEKRATKAAQKYDKSIAGTYTVTASALNIRDGAGTQNAILGDIPKGTKVANYGYYSLVGTTKWLYIQVTYNGVRYTGFCSGTYLKRT